MPRPSSSSSSSLLIPAALVGLLVVGLAQAQQCPAGSQVITIASDGSVTFSSVPNGSLPLTPAYDPGALGGWYNLASGFNDAVRPGSLPYETFRNALTSTGVQCSISPDPNCGTTNPTTADSSGEFDPVALIQELATWWTAIIVVVCIGILFALGFLIVGGCFWCCRCCGNCGGAKTQKVRKNHDVMTISFTIVLLLFTLVLCVAVILAFFSNEQTFDSLDTFESSANTITDEGVGYVEDTLDEVNILLCQFASPEGLIGQIEGEALGVQRALEAELEGIEGEVLSIIGTLRNSATGLNTTRDILENITMTTSALLMAGDDLQSSLNGIIAGVIQLRSDCDQAIINASGNAELMMICGQIADSETFVTGINFTAFPNVSSELADVREAVDNFDIMAELDNGEQLFNTTTGDIQNQVDSSLDSGLQFLDDANDTVTPLFNNVTSTVQNIITGEMTEECPALEEALNVDPSVLTVEYIRQCVLNQAFDFVRQYDVYRYAFGIVICSLSLVTIVLVFLGILLGMLGFRKDREPHLRTNLSHCGGIFLLIGVALTFLFGFFLLVLVIIGFFFSVNTQKLCQSLQGERYELFEELIDNETYWGTSLIGDRVFNGFFGVSGVTLSVSAALRECERNEPLFSVFNLSTLLTEDNISDEINTRLNVSEMTTELQSFLNDSVSNFNFTDESFLSMDAQRSLQDFRNASVQNINTTAYEDQLNNAIVAFNITATISDLQQLDAQLANLSTQQPALVPAIMPIQAQIPPLILQLMDLQTNDIPAVQTQVDILSGEVEELVRVIATVVTNIVATVDNITSLVQNITMDVIPDFVQNTVIGAVERVVASVDSYISHLDVQVSTQVARCQPLWAIYTELFNSVCFVFLDGLNGFWWSLGFCTLLFIPVIVFSVITATCYLRKKPEEYDDSYTDFPLKAY